MGILRMSLLSLVLVMASGCATQGIDRANQNVIVETFIAKLNGVEQVTLSSHVKTGMVLGATDGALTSAVDHNGEHFLGSVLVGALVGGLFTALFEGSNQAFEYQLFATKHGNFSVVQKQQLASEVTCVEVRKAAKGSLTAIPQAHCSKL